MAVVSDFKKLTNFENPSINTGVIEDKIQLFGNCQLIITNLKVSKTFKRFGPSDFIPKTKTLFHY